jgi:hypothetical protein
MAYRGAHLATESSPNYDGDEEGTGKGTFRGLPRGLPVLHVFLFRAGCTRSPSPTNIPTAAPSTAVAATPSPVHAGITDASTRLSKVQ